MGDVKRQAIFNFEVAYGKVTQHILTGIVVNQ